MDYIKKMGLGGTMCWEISADFPTSHPLSLLKMMNQWIGGPALDRTMNRVCYPGSKYSNIRDNALCPSPPKDKEIAIVSEEEKLAWRTTRIVQYCLNLHNRQKMKQNDGKGLAGWDIVEMLRYCANQLEDDRTDF
jgi:GH18 family chitinase